MYIQYLYSTKTMKLLLSIIKKKRFEDIRSCKYKKDRQLTDQKKNDKTTNNGGQNTTQKTKDWETGTPKNPDVNSSCSYSGTRRVTHV